MGRAHDRPDWRARERWSESDHHGGLDKPVGMIQRLAERARKLGRDIEILGDCVRYHHLHRWSVGGDGVFIVTEFPIDRPTLEEALSDPVCYMSSCSLEYGHLEAHNAAGQSNRSFAIKPTGPTSFYDK